MVTFNQQLKLKMQENYTLKMERYFFDFLKSQDAALNQQLLYWLRIRRRSKKTESKFKIWRQSKKWRMENTFRASSSSVHTFLFFAFESNGNISIWVRRREDIRNSNLTPKKNRRINFKIRNFLLASSAALSTE